MSTTYVTRTVAIQRAIIEPLTGRVADYDIEAIADRIIEHTEHGYVCPVEPDEFWQIASEHDLSANAQAVAEFEQAIEHQPAWAK
ncbi:hypothetical protein [Blastococcus sp. Marseille-P5729]|uniref:hypothetical protein n=1 Tax=Blastococcus sp. Marseille-P5729 TaxID=2086582 RepID=UPI000D0F8AE4|nr:hypothetical protein [Blastococcus sp. Marseille-P5729]